MDDTVINFPTPLERRWERAKGYQMACETNREQWAANALALCIELAALRDEYADNAAFGAACEAAGISLNDDTRAAAIAMGRDPDKARDVLSKTRRSSLQTVYRREFKDTLRNVTKSDSPMTPKVQEAYIKVVELEEAGEPLPPAKDVAKQVGVSKGTAARALYRRVAERAAGTATPLPEPLSPDDLSPGSRTRYERTVATKLRELERAYAAKLRELEAAYAAKVRELEASHEARRAEEVQDWVMNVIHPRYNKEKEHYAAVLKSRHKGVMTKEQFKAIRACLHPDSNMTPERKRPLFDLWSALTIPLLSHEDEPVEIETLPRTPEEWYARKAAYAAERKAKRDAAKAAKAKPKLVD